jgi:hypothetical protein
LKNKNNFENINSFFRPRTFQSILVDRKYVESFEMWCWRRTEKIIWADCVRNKVSVNINMERNILQTVKGRKEGRKVNSIDLA